MNLFGKKPTLKEQLRDNDRALRKAGREIDRDRRELEKEEKKLEMEIRKMAQTGNKQACAVLAKQLVQLRKQKTRTFSATGKVQAVGFQAKAMHANVKMADAMGTTAKTMASMNKVVKPEQVAQTMKEFEMASTKMDMSEDLINSTLDDILDESGDEEESDYLVQKVLDEIGIEVSGKLAGAPLHHGEVGESSSSKLPSDVEIEAQLARLRN